MEILREYTVSNFSSFWGAFAFLFGLIGAILCIVNSLPDMLKRDFRRSTFYNVIALTICTTILFCGIIFGKEKEKRYEVKVNNDITIGELTEKYNVVGQNGDIWILSEKSN